MWSRAYYLEITLRLFLAELQSVVRRASGIVCQHLKTNIQTSFSIKLLHLQISNFTWRMTWHQGLRIIKLGQDEYPRWRPLLKIAKITKSTFSPERLDIFG